MLFGRGSRISKQSAPPVKTALREELHGNGRGIEKENTGAGSWPRIISWNGTVNLHRGHAHAAHATHAAHAAHLVHATRGSGRFG